MLVVMQEGTSEALIQKVIDRLIEDGFDVHRSTGAIHTVLGGVGGPGEFDTAVFEVMEGVKEVHRIVSPYKLASRAFRPHGTVVKIGDVEIGGGRVVVMAGPCSVESRDQIERAADIVSDGGASVIRGRAFKPRV
jgi:3-deoxy-7-phosphoheptulonate synthase